MRHSSLILLLLVSWSLHIQGEQWCHYRVPATIFDLKTQNNTLWICSSAGLTELNLLNNEMKLYTMCNSSVNTQAFRKMEIDTQGRLWFATDLSDGVYMKSGETWQHFTTQNSLLLDDHITAIGASPDGSIWFGTNTGFCRYYEGNWINFTSANTSLPANIYPGIIRFRSPNELWAVGTDGYYLFNGTQWLHYTMENANLPSNILTDIAFDEDITWFTSEEGAIKLQNGIYTTYQTSNSGLPYNQCNCIAVDSFHNVWIGTCHMLAKFNYTGWTIYSTGNTPLQNNVIDKMVIDCYNNLWIGIPITIKPENLLKFDGENWTTYYPAICPLTLNTVKHFSLGSDGSVWFNCLGEFDGCVLKYDFENWTFYNCENIEMPCPCARAIVCDDSLNTYLATCIGVVKITPTGTVQYPGTIYRPGAITLDNNSTLWLGNSAYFSHWNGQGWTIYSETDIGHPIGQTEILRKDNFGNIWFGTQNGLFCYNNGTWEFYNAASNCLYSHWVKDIYIQADNSLWIADSALTYFDGNIWTHYTCENSPFLHNNVSAVTMDANQVLWIGTDGDGLYRKDGNSWAHFTTDNSCLPSNYIVRLIVDRNNTLWIGTKNDGIALYNRNGLASVDSPNLPFPMHINVNVYPNPFNPETTISFENPSAGIVSAEIYNLRGQKITTLHNGFLNCGEQKFCWNGKDENGNNLGSGLYLFKMKGKEFEVVRKLSLIK